MTLVTPHSTLAEPLRQIGLSISGGGFRAAAFGLGCLSYLNRCVLPDAEGQPHPLLEHVTFMSTTSGGSFVSLFYARNLYQKKTFADTYRELREIMDGEQLLSSALRILNDPDAWIHTPDKQRNLINAYALACNECFGGDTFEPLCQPDAPDYHPHLRQICVNSTEFRNGLSFRFQNIDGKTRTGLVGNYNLFLRRDSLDTIRKLRLGDIMAASSCFPAGFEPLVFPRDFTYQEPGTGLSSDELEQAIFCRNAIDQTADLTRYIKTSTQVLSEVNLTIEAEKADEKAENDRLSMPTTKSTVPCDATFGLMDGGVDDNQGIQGLILGNNRRQRQRGGKGFDTFIVCDVDAPYMDPYTSPVVDNTGLRRLSIVKLALLASLLVVVIPTGVAFWYVSDSVIRTILLTFSGVMFSLGGGLLLAVWLKIRSIRKGAWAPVVQDFGSYLFHIPFGTLYQMVAARLESVVLLAGDVFMRQIRRLTYQQFYSNEKWKNRRIATLIYELSTDYYSITKARNKRWSAVPPPSLCLQNVAEDARKMATTLWFGPDQVKGEMRDKIIATGQFTMCYNLMEYLDDVKNVPMSPEHKKVLDELNTQLMADWQRFQDKPLWMV